MDRIYFRRSGEGDGQESHARHSRRHCSYELQHEFYECMVRGAYAHFMDSKFVVYIRRNVAFLRRIGHGKVEDRRFHPSQASYLRFTLPWRRYVCVLLKFAVFCVLGVSLEGQKAHSYAGRPRVDPPRCGLEPKKWSPSDRGVRLWLRHETSTCYMCRGTCLCRFFCRKLIIVWTSNGISADHPRTLGRRV